MKQPSKRPTFFRFLQTILLCALATVFFSQGATAQEQASATGQTSGDYLLEIKPLLAAKCAPCHGTLRQEAGLRLDHGLLLRTGGDSGSVIEVAGAEPSELIKRVTSNESDIRMPPEGEGERLNDEQIQLLSQWLAEGATSPADEPIPASPDQHWAWQLPKRSAIPAVQNHLWTRNPIDVFVRKQLDTSNLQPLPMAEPRVKLRRLYFDLIGLPPTPEEQGAFLADPSPEAWEATVQRLLLSPSHGERWARHWMDVWRYSDWDGYKDELRGSARHIWHWRDWIVESLNTDKGYDQMIVEMLAADEVAPENEDVRRATGFLARNFHKSNRNIWLDATVEHTAKAFLGLTINCAKCHDHKYDPISQQEFYAFRAIFEPHDVRTDRVPGEPDIKKAGIPRVYDAQPTAKTFLFVGGNEKSPDEDNPILAAPPAIVNVPFDIAEVDLPDAAVFPALRAFVENEERAKALQEVAQEKATFRAAQEKDTAKPQLDLARQSLAAARARLKSLTARWAADRYKFTQSSSDEHYNTLKRQAVRAERRSGFLAAKLAATQKQQAFKNASDMNAANEKEDKGKAVENAKLELDKAMDALAKAEQLHHAAIDADDDSDLDYTAVGSDYPTHSTGRRTALANWIANRKNPLTARVAVNHVWMHYFGEPLVANVFDFGLRSPEPVHRELLDCLAIELMDHDWSLKHLHQLITSSQTYQTASSQPDMQPFSSNQELDPENQLLWRANVRRLDAEVIRDSLLYAAENLDSALGGPDIDFAQGESVFRRSLYFRHAYEKQMEMLVLFDAAGPTECYRRSESIIPQQALALANSPLSIDQSRRLAQQIWQSDPIASTELSDTSAIERAFTLLLGRECSSEELGLCVEFLASQSQLLSGEEALVRLPGKTEGATQPASDPLHRARENLIHTLINHNDFITLR